LRVATRRLFFRRVAKLSMRLRRGVALRYDRCAHAFFVAITIAATVSFWLGQ
jgi:hypothetical protein